MIQIPFPFGRRAERASHPASRRSTLRSGRPPSDRFPEPASMIDWADLPTYHPATNG